MMLIGHGCSCNKAQSALRKQNNSTSNGQNPQSVNHVTIFSGTNQDSELSPSALPTTPPRILPLQPSIHLITIQDPPVYQVVQTLSISPPVITIPVSAAAATSAYILCEFLELVLFNVMFSVVGPFIGSYRAVTEPH